MIIGVILAGGGGKRMWPVTSGRLLPVTSSGNANPMPKALVQVLGGRAIDYTLEAYMQMGLRRVYVTTSNNDIKSPEQIARHLKDHPRLKPIIVNEAAPKDTAGSINYLIANTAFADSDTLIIQACDTPHNLGPQLNMMLADHQSSNADITMGVAPIAFNSKEWRQRSFATVVTDEMPERSSRLAENRLEKETNKYYADNIGRSRHIRYFCEQRDQCSLETRASPFINANIYMVNVGFWRDRVGSLIQKDFSDFGFHIFPAITGQYDHPSSKYTGRVRSLSRECQFNAYFFDLENSFWHDVGTPALLWLANNEGLKRPYNNPQTFGRTWRRMPWGWCGLDTEVSPRASVLNSYEGSLGNLIGEHCQVKRNTKINNSVIGDNVEIGEDVTIDTCVVLPGARISNRAKLVNCIVCGGTYNFKGPIKPFSTIYNNTQGGISIDPWPAYNPDLKIR